MDNNFVFGYNIPTKILFGCGELKRLSTEALPGKKALIIISSGTSMRKYGYLDKVIDLLKENNVDYKYYVLPHSGHGLQNDNKISRQWMETVEEYLDRYMGTN